MTVPSIRRQISVPADPERAFAIFTEAIGRWWPLASLSVFGEDATVGLEDGVIVERAPDGRSTVWAEVTVFEPGQRLELAWHPGAGVQSASTVTVTFTAIEEATLVSLVHSGWEALTDPAGARAEYDHGWPDVLDAYVAQIETEEDEDDTWVALMHVPGPGAPTDRPPQADPRFAGHVAFLQSMHAAGYLVAAGPLGDEPGAGMTVLRLPGQNRLDEAQALAEADRSVADGLLSVSVRPWNVLFDATA